MHALLAHAYHLAQYGVHVLLLPLWHAPAAAMAVAAAGRISGLVRTRRGAAVTACGAVLAGWMLLDQGWAGWPPPPVARLPGLALILLAGALLRGGARPGGGWPVTLVTAALAAWWLRGAPGGAALLGCVPVFGGLAAGLPAARRLARGVSGLGEGSLSEGGLGEGGSGERGLGEGGLTGGGRGAGGLREGGRGDNGLGNAAAALVLAAGIMLAGASAHWARAAVVPAVAALVLLGVPEAGSALAGTIVLVAASTIVASDRGRVLAVDLACLAPLLVWPVAAWFAARAGRGRTAQRP